MCLLSAIIRYDVRAGFWGKTGEPCLGIIPVRSRVFSLHFLFVDNRFRHDKESLFHCSLSLKNLIIPCQQIALLETQVSLLMGESCTRKILTYFPVEDFQPRERSPTSLKFPGEFLRRTLAKSQIAQADLPPRKFHSLTAY